LSREDPGTRSKGSRREDFQNVIYFDRDASFFALDSSSLEEYRLETNSPQPLDAQTRLLPGGRTKVVTDGDSYYVLSPQFLTPKPFVKPTDLDLERLQSHFFSAQAVEAALGVPAEAMESKDRGSLVYGTTGAASIYEALSRIAAGPKDRFLDIGCGCGLPVLVASHLVGRATGLDIVPSMIDFAKRSAADFGRSNAHFLAANIRDVDVRDVDIVYVAATTLSQELRGVIATKLEQLRPGAVVISLTYSFPSEHLVLVDSFKSPFAWWSTSAPTEHSFLIHVRRPL